MTNDQPPSLNLEQVVERFGDSEHALRELESKIQSLAELEEQTERATRTLEDSSSRMAAYASETRELTQELAEVSEKARQLLLRAREVLDGSQLQRIEDLVGQRHDALEERISEQAGDLADLRGSISDVESQVSESSSRIISELDDTEQLEGIRASLGELGPKLVSQFQQRLASVEETVAGGNTRTMWLLVGVLALQAVVIVLSLTGGS